MANNVQVAISKDFMSGLSRVSNSAKISKFLIKFMADPQAPGLNFEKIKNVQNNTLWSVRIDDTYRCIVYRQKESGVYILLWIDHHDKAYQWAASKRIKVNFHNGMIQVYDSEIISQEECNSRTKAATDPLFSSLSDVDLARLQVPEEHIPYIKALTNIEELRNIKDSIPADVYECLEFIASGISVDEVLEYRDTVSEEAKPINSLAEALQTPAALSSFVVIENEDDLRRIIEAPLETWRVFLHPAQRKIVEKTYSGPAKILGGAGTGKTVVAMHRAKYLASKLGEGEKILFTTFTKNLAADIKNNLKKICSLKELSKIEVINLDAWVSKFLRDSEYNVKIVYDTNALWEKAITLADTALPFDVDFYKEEWNRVAIAQEALSLEKYCKVSRTGRSRRLNRQNRIQIWKVFEAYLHLIKEDRVRDINMAMYESAELIRSEGSHDRYAHIIVDEGQDFSDNAYRLLRTLAGEEHSDDLFIVGDSHQRIYSNKPVLSKCGINVRGRSKNLKINYRTTEEIRKYAFSVLGGLSFDDLDDGFDSNKCLSLTHGAKPIVENFSGADNELAYIVQEIKNLQNNGVELSNICLTVRTNKLVDDYKKHLESFNIKVCKLKDGEEDKRFYEGVRVATMHRVKGLEFEYVFIAATNNGLIPLGNCAELSPEAITSEKCLLYVAMTRAKKGVYVTSYGKASAFVR